MAISRMDIGRLLVAIVRPLSYTAVLLKDPCPSGLPLKVPHIAPQATMSTGGLSVPRIGTNECRDPNIRAPQEGNPEVYCDLKAQGGLSSYLLLDLQPCLEPAPLLEDVVGAPIRSLDFLREVLTDLIQMGTGAYIYIYTHICTYLYIYICMYICMYDVYHQFGNVDLRPGRRWNFICVLAEAV